MSKEKKQTEDTFDFRKVIFEDASSGERFLLYSAVVTEETAKWEDGQEYPLYKVEISSASHPFYTGKETSLDRAGRAEKFRKRAAKAKPASKVEVKETAPEAPAETEEVPAEEATTEATEA